MFGGEKVKGISKRVGVGVLSLMFLLALVSASPVVAKVPLRWDVSAAYDGVVTWNGDVYAEDGSHGVFTLTVLDAVFLSNVQHSICIWRIDWGDDVYIEGTALGTFVYTTTPLNMMDGGDYVFNGEVTYASPEWSYLVGRNTHVMGHVTPWPWTTEGVLQIN